MNRKNLCWLLSCVMILLGVGGVFVKGKTEMVRSAPLHYDPFVETAEPFRQRMDLPASVRTTSEPSLAAQGTQGWEVISQQYFPDASAWGGWEVTPDSGHRWGINEISTGNWGAWVDGATQSVTFNSGETYTNSMETWLVYGPIEGSQDLWDLKVAFNYFISLEEGDYFKVGYSTDGELFQGLEITSLQMVAPSWAAAELSFDVGRGNDQLWVGFGFTSDESGVAQGVWLDDIILSANYGTTLSLPLIYRNWGEAYVGFFDDFSDSESGWPQRTYDRPDGTGDFMTVGYVDETYRMKVLLNTDGKNNQKTGFVKAPYENNYTDYDVSVDHYFARASDQGDNDPVGGAGGLIFAANDTYSSLYAFQWNFEGGCAVSRFDNVSLPVSGLGDFDVTPIRDWGSCSDYGLIGDAYGSDDTNHLLVEVRGNRARVYVVNNNTKKKVTEFTADFLNTHHNVGLLTGAYDWTPVESRFDNFKVEPVD